MSVDSQPFAVYFITIIHFFSFFFSFSYISAGFCFNLRGFFFVGVVVIGVAVVAGTCIVLSLTVRKLKTPF